MGQHKITKRKLEIVGEYYPTGGCKAVREEYIKQGLSGDRNDTINSLASRYNIKKTRKSEDIHLNYGYVMWITQWGDERKMTTIGSSPNGTSVQGIHVTKCGREVQVKILVGYGLSEPRHILYNQEKNRYETKLKQFARKMVLDGLKCNEFWCCRCDRIYNNSFLRQKGESSGNKCKSCYNLGRVEEKQNNEQARIRNNLHHCLNKFLKSGNKGFDGRVSVVNGVPINKSDLVREALAAGLSTSRDIINYVKDTYNIDIAAKVAWQAKRRSSGSKLSYTETVIGCSPVELRQWIEDQFEEGWTYKNKGVLWEIDHIIPYKAFDLTDPEQVKRVMHHTNVRPLSISDNRRKGDRLDSGI